MDAPGLRRPSFQVIYYTFYMDEVILHLFFWFGVCSVIYYICVERKSFYCIEWLKKYIIITSMKEMN